MRGLRFSHPRSTCLFLFGCHVFTSSEGLPAFINRCSRSAQLSAGKRSMRRRSKSRDQQPVNNGVVTELPNDCGTYFFFARLPRSPELG